MNFKNHVILVSYQDYEEHELNILITMFTDFYDSNIFVEFWDFFYNFR